MFARDQAGMMLYKETLKEETLGESAMQQWCKRPRPKRATTRCGNKETGFML
jgi:hypothetical protein